MERRIPYWINNDGIIFRERRLPKYILCIEPLGLSVLNSVVTGLALPFAQRSMCNICCTVDLDKSGCNRSKTMIRVRISLKRRFQKFPNRFRSWCWHITGHTNANMFSHANGGCSCDRSARFTTRVRIDIELDATQLTGMENGKDLGKMEKPSTAMTILLAWPPTMSASANIGWEAVSPSRSICIWSVCFFFFLKKKAFLWLVPT